jgi:DNA-binding transcriptional regulator YdaS (Cro superfamily)
MMTRTEKLLNALKDWCAEKYGRQSEIARLLSVSPQQLTDWFKGRTQLTGEQALAIQEFMRHRRRKASGTATPSQ